VAGNVDTELRERVPPQSIEAEMAVLGSILLDPHAITRVLEILDAGCFYRRAHQKIFDAAVHLFEQNQPVDLLTVAEELSRRNELDAVGGNYYLTELARTVPSAANVEYYAKIVLEKALARRLLDVTSEIQEKVYEGVDSIYDIIDGAEQKIFSLRERRLREGFRHINPLLHRTFEVIESYHQRRGMTTGVPSGFPALDNITSGFQPSDFIVIAGRPSMGKTAFALNIARNAAVDYGIPVGIISLEMAGYQLTLRMLCSEARIDAHLLRTGRLEPSEWTKLSMAVGRLDQAPIYIDDRPAQTILEIRAKARRAKAEYNIGLLIIDYLQLIRGTGRIESRQMEISMISQALKALAKELDIPVVALSQLSRAVEQRAGERRPILSDLRESGAIEQDADVVIFIYRPEVYGPTEKPGIAEIIVAKQRNGPTDTVELAFVKEYALFANLARYDEREVPPAEQFVPF